MRCWGWIGGRDNSETVGWLLDVSFDCTGQRDFCGPPGALKSMKLPMNGYKNN